MISGIISWKQDFPSLLMIRTKTGMIGDEYTPITTSLGSGGGEADTANPDMAALLVQMLTEAGVKSGDTIGAGFSGSFSNVESGCAGRR